MKQILLALRLSPLSSRIENTPMNLNLPTIVFISHDAITIFVEHYVALKDQQHILHFPQLVTYSVVGVVEIICKGTKDHTIIS